MEPWVQVVIATAGILTPLMAGIIGAAWVRDRSLLTMIAAIKEDAGRTVQATGEALHERVNRVRDEYVRRDDLDAHLKRIDKRLDDMTAESRRAHERTDQRLDTILKQLRQAGGGAQP